jgi:hypothetical protein
VASRKKRGSRREIQRDKQEGYRNCIQKRVQIFFVSKLDIPEAA